MKTLSLILIILGISITSCSKEEQRKDCNCNLIIQIESIEGYYDNNDIEISHIMYIENNCSKELDTIKWAANANNIYNYYSVGEYYCK